MKVYLDNAATTKVDLGVVETMNKYHLEEYGNASSLHEKGRKSSNAISDARRTIARIFNAETSEIIFTSGGTESNNIAIQGIAKNNPGCHIITSKIEHPAVLNTCKDLEKQGHKVTYINVDEKGIIKIKEIEKAITKETKLISIMHANNEIGTIQPIEKIGEIAKKNKIKFHTDAVQSFLKIPIDTKKINVDLITISSHKIHGPKGVGALYIKNGTQLKPIILGGGQEKNIRSGTTNTPGIVGFGEASKLNQKINEIKEVRDYLIKRTLDEIPQTKLNGHEKDRLPNNANIAFSHIEGESVLIMLDEEGIAVSTGSACASNSLQPSHVLIATGMDHKDAHGCIRFSLSKFTTKKDIDYMLEKLKPIIEKLRSYSPLS